MNKTQAFIEIAEIICKNCTGKCNKKECKDLKKLKKVIRKLEEEQEDEASSRKNSKKPKEKSSKDFCQKCKRGCNDTAVVPIRGSIRWFYYDCYQAYIKKEMMLNGI